MSKVSSDPVAPSADGAARGVVAGVVPLLLALVIVALGMAGAALARAAISPAGADGFLAWQGVALAAWGAALALAALAFGLAAVRALRHAAQWRSAGLVTRGAAATWTLLVAALVLLIPVIVALALPQHPAP